MATKTKHAGQAHIQGEALWRALGFKNERTFQRARRDHWSGPRLYPIPGQSRGVYARLDELTSYLEGRTTASGEKEGDMT
jgi:hypothetical protein